MGSSHGMHKGSLSYDRHSPPVALPRQRRDDFRKGKRRRSRVQQQQHSQSGKEKLCVIPLSNRKTGSGTSGIGARGLTRPSAETVNRVGGSAHKTIDLVSSGRKDLGEHVGNGKCGNQQTRQQKPTLKRGKRSIRGKRAPHQGDNNLIMPIPKTLARMRNKAKSLCLSLTTILKQISITTREER